MAREMKDSGIAWIGEIPEGWVLKKLKNSCSLFGRIGFRGYTADDLVQEGEGAITLSPTNFNGINLDFTKCSYLSWDKYYESPEIMVKEGDLLLVKTASVGKCAYVEHLPQETTVNPQILVLKEHKDVSKFIAYIFQTPIGQSYIDITKGGSTIFTISQEKIGNYIFAFPPLPEQRAIADYLDRKCGEIDELISLQEKMIEELKAYKQSVITEAVTKGLNPNVPMKDSGIEWIGEIPEHWEIKKIKYIVDSIYKGYGITKDEVFADGDIPCVRYGEIYSKYNHAFIECVSATKKELHITPRYFYQGDILCAGTGELVEEIGKSIVYLGNKLCLAGGDIIVIRHCQIPSFLNYALNSDYAQAQKSKGKAKLKVVHISASEIGNILITLPPLSEQQSIADYLDNKCSEIDSLIALKQKKIEELKEYKKSMIYEYVTGKKEV